MERRNYLFSGRVQNVGFRYVLCKLCEQRGLTGWVRNLVSGEVEAYIQGDVGLICGVFTALKEDDYIRIDKMRYDVVPVCEHEISFEIKF